MSTIKDLKARQAERAKAYKERMKAKGMRGVFVYISEDVLKETGSSPQKLVDIHINSRGKEHDSLFPEQQSQVVQEVKDLKDTVKQLNIRLEALCTEVEGLKAMVDKIVQIEPQTVDTTEKIPEGNTNKPPKIKKSSVKFDPAWVDEFNNRVKAGEQLSKRKFATEKGVNVATIVRHIKGDSHGKT
ncbi:MAG: hypothetical protein HQL06_06810 [Nitrospirae bacterium]|nr:hypothetical protein [Nitrospirota bacterium]